MGGQKGTEEAPASACCSPSPTPTGPPHRVLPSELRTLGSACAVNLRVGGPHGGCERHCSAFIYFRPTGLSGASPSLQMRTVDAVCVPQLLSLFTPASFLGARCPGRPPSSAVRMHAPSPELTWLSHVAPSAHCSCSPAKS